MSTVPPELIRLGQSYDALVSNAEAGHISHADALATLAGLTATDASGAVWGLNADGDYVRSQYPGAPAQVSDPSMFAQAGAPAPAPFQAPGAFPQQGMPAAPAVPGPPVAQPTMSFPSPPGPVTQPAQPAQPQAAPMAFQGAPHDPFAAPPQGFYPEAGLPSAANPIPDPHHHSTKKAPTKEAPTKSISDAGKPSPFAGVFGKVRQLVGGNLVLVGIVVVGIVLFGVLSLQSKGADPGSTTLPSGTSETTDPALAGDGTGSDELPADGSQDPAVPSLPSKAMATQMYSALASGKRDLVAGTTASKPDATVAALAAAEWAGARQIGLTVTPGAAVAQGQGAVQTWTVADGSTTAATVKVTWVLAGETWKLAQLPLFPNP